MRFRAMDVRFRDDSISKLRSNGSFLFRSQRGQPPVFCNRTVSRPVDIQLSHAGAQGARMEAKAFGRGLRPLDSPIAGGQGSHDVRSLNLLQSLKLCRFRRRQAGRGAQAVENKQSRSVRNPSRTRHPMAAYGLAREAGASPT